MQIVYKVEIWKTWKTQPHWKAAMEETKWFSSPAKAFEFVQTYNQNALENDELYMEASRPESVQIPTANEIDNPSLT